MQTITFNKLINVPILLVYYHELSAYSAGESVLMFVVRMYGRCPRVVGGLVIGRHDPP